MKKVDAELLKNAIVDESRRFEECYLWLEKNMTPSFFEEFCRDNLMVIAHSLVGFHLQNYFCQINLQKMAIVLCRNSPDADLRILERYSDVGIKHYRTWVSKAPIADDGECFLRVASIHYSTSIEEKAKGDSFADLEKLKGLVKQRNSDVSDADFRELMSHLDTRMLGSLSLERLAVAVDMYFRATTRDHVQYEVAYNDNWKEKDLSSMQIVLAWRNVPKHNFLLRLMRMGLRHDIVVHRVSATYIKPQSPQCILVMALNLHGVNGLPAWQSTDISDFLKELATLKYFDDMDRYDSVFVTPKLIRGNLGNLLRAMEVFIHQALVHIDPHLYTMNAIEEALCRHIELTVRLLEAFEYKFNPDIKSLLKFEECDKMLITLVDKLDTGNESNDTRRKMVLKQGLNMVRMCLKTNFYTNNKSALSFRLDPKYLEELPPEVKEKFPDLPYAIFFVKGMHFFGFHVRFKDLARGGVRTVFPAAQEEMLAERNNVFGECYNLAFTQHRKNKDIPEGGAKAVIFLKPFEEMNKELEIWTKELHAQESQNALVETYAQALRLEYLYQAQRAFVQGLMTLINSENDGTLKAKNVVDYWKKPEYIYLGPDENMHNIIIEWIAKYSLKVGYKPGASFITSKPGAGINHKEYGVTSLGVNTCMHEVLLFLGLRPEKDTFTVKISGGPDGDVAGNQIYNLFRFYPKTARLLAVTDVSGTIQDLQGLDLHEMARLFKEGLALNKYPPQKLNEGGFLLDRMARKDERGLTAKTLCYRKESGRVHEDWLSGSEMNSLYRNNVHKTPADIFIPAGGRPRTLNERNLDDFFLDNKLPSSKAIIEGANLYLSQGARKKLEGAGVLIIKDSSANKGGVICSSFEVLCGLAMNEERFLAKKARICYEILKIIETSAKEEAQLILKEHRQYGSKMTEVSEQISLKINAYTDQLLDYLDTVTLSQEPQDPFNACFLNYCPPSVQEEGAEHLLREIPDSHKKAIIASRVASRLVYRWGLNWSPTVVDILPVIWKDAQIVGGWV